MVLSTEGRRRLRFALDRAITARLATHQTITPGDLAAWIEAACADAGATAVTTRDIEEIIYEGQDPRLDG